MLLVADIGNTSISFAYFKNSRLTKQWRLPTKGADIIKLRDSLLRHAGKTTSKTHGACISSVVPSLNSPIRKVIRKIFGCPVIFVTAKNAGIKISRYNPREIGADRLVNAVAAVRKYKYPLIIVDFGTATTFDFITANGEYAGGAICPGIELANLTLSQMTAKLPFVKIEKTKNVVGKKTKESMQSGLFHGYVGLVDHMVNSIRKETKTKAKVISTGGLAKLIAPATKTIEKVEPDLTLEGLQIIWKENN